MTRNSTILHASFLAALLLHAGSYDIADSPKDRAETPWRRKKWQKGASGGPGGPAVKLTIPGRRRP